jgi:hypothetical protein
MLRVLGSERAAWSTRRAIVAGTVLALALATAAPAVAPAAVPPPPVPAPDLALTPPALSPDAASAPSAFTPDPPAVGAGLVAPTAPTATIPVISAYLTRTKRLIGPCAGSAVSTIGSFAANPNTARRVDPQFEAGLQAVRRSQRDERPIDRPAHDFEQRAAVAQALGDHLRAAPDLRRDTLDRVGWQRPTPSGTLPIAVWNGLLTRARGSYRMQLQIIGTVNSAAIPFVTSFGPNRAVYYYWTTACMTA